MVKVTKNGDRKHHGIFCYKRAVTFFLDINPLDATSLCKKKSLKIQSNHQLTLGVHRFMHLSLLYFVS